MRPNSRAAVLPLALCALTLLAVACGSRPAPEPPAATAEGETTGEDGGPRSQAERTREMEARAADLEAQAREARENAAQMSEEEKLRAYEQFEADRQKLNEVGEGGGEEPVE